MRKYTLIFALGVALTLTACGSGFSKKKATDSTNVEVDTVGKTTADTTTVSVDTTGFTLVK